MNVVATKSGKPPRRRKSLKDKIEAAEKKQEDAVKAASDRINALEVTIQGTNEKGFIFPWTAHTAKPWKDGYERILIPLKEPTKNGVRALFKIVANSKLIYGRKSAIA